MASEYAGWTPPQFNLSTTPTLYQTTHLSPDPFFHHNFARQSQWCSDGSAVLAQCENRSFQVMHGLDGAQDSHSTEHPVRPTLSVFPQPASIVRALWFPTASTQDPASFCFIASVRECPVKLLDASDGRLRASYRIVDHRERFIAPHSLAFSPTADKLYCGFEDAIELFDVHRPGTGTRLATIPSKKSKDGLKGIISALAFPPAYQPTSYFAAGSLTPSENNIALFENDADAKSVLVPLMSVGGCPGSGVTQLMFNPAAPHILYASFRRREGVYVWDLRGDASAPISILTPTLAPATKADRAPQQAALSADHDMERSEMPPEPVPGLEAGNLIEKGENFNLTNQVMNFGVDIAGRVLGQGDQKGFVSLYDISSHTSATAPPISEDPYTERVPELVKPSLRFQAHRDSVGVVAFRPLRPQILSASGSRHFDVQESESEEDEQSNGEDEVADNSAVESNPQPKAWKGLRRPWKRRHPTTVDSSLKLWDFSPEEGRG